MSGIARVIRQSSAKSRQDELAKEVGCAPIYYRKIGEARKKLKSSVNIKTAKINEIKKLIEGEVQKLELVQSEIENFQHNLSETMHTVSGKKKIEDA